MTASSIYFAQGVERGCGQRKKGGVYLEVGMGPGGMPVEHFLYDAPILVPDALKLPARGVKLIEQNGVVHVVDRIGLKHYVNVAAFIEETRRFGISRRISSRVDFSLLTAQSKLLLVHDRAWMDNIAPYGHWTCPKDKPEHAPDQHPQMCAGVWWEDVDGGINIDDSRDVDYVMPGGWHFTARKRPADHKPNYRPAFFAAFSIHRIAVVKGDDHYAALERARASRQIEVVEVDA